MGKAWELRKKVGLEQLRGSGGGRGKRTGTKGWCPHVGKLSEALKLGDAKGFFPTSLVCVCVHHTPTYTPYTHCLSLAYIHTDTERTLKKLLHLRRNGVGCALQVGVPESGQ